MNNLADGTYVSVVLLDAEPIASKDGAKGTHLMLEIVKPRLYAGRQVHFRVYDSMEQTITKLAVQFPETNFLEAENVWDTLGGGSVHRARIGLDAAHTHGGVEYGARNRVTSMYSNDKRSRNDLDGFDEAPF